VDRFEAQNFVWLLEQNKNSLLFTEDFYCLFCYGTYHHSAGCMSGGLERHCQGKQFNFTYACIVVNGICTVKCTFAMGLPGDGVKVIFFFFTLLYLFAFSRVMCRKIYCCSLKRLLKGQKSMCFVRKYIVQ